MPALTCLPQPSRQACISVAFVKGSTAQFACRMSRQQCMRTWRHACLQVMWTVLWVLQKGYHMLACTFDAVKADGRFGQSAKLLALAAGVVFARHQAGCSRCAGWFGRCYLCQS